MLRELIRSTVLVAAVASAGACEAPPTVGDADRLDDNGAAPEAEPADTPRGAATAGVPTGPSSTGPVTTGQLAPALALPDVETGETWDLATYLDPAGESSPKGFLVAFMASWCQYCTQSLPTLVKMERAYPDLAVVTVTVDATPEARKAELATVRAAGLSAPVLAADGAALSAWVGGGSSVPRYYFIDHRGVVVAQNRGFNQEMEVRMAAQARRTLGE